MECLSDAGPWAAISSKCMRMSEVSPAKQKPISVSPGSLVGLARCARPAPIDYKLMIVIDSVIVQLIKGRNDCFNWRRDLRRREAGLVSGGRSDPNCFD
jgi:hypothetical protein